MAKKQWKRPITLPSRKRKPSKKWGKIGSPNSHKRKAYMAKIRKMK